MRQRSRGPERLGRVLEQSLEGRRLASVLVDAEILARWEEAVGPSVAARARPETLRDGVLVVRVASSPWMTELSYLKPTLLRRINGVLAAPVVTDLRLVSGALPVEAVRAPAAPPTPLTPEQGRRVEAMTAGVSDPLLREAIARAYGRALASGPPETAAPRTRSPRG